jgi:hypothetical protein
METVRLRSNIGNDGHLRVDIPTALPKGEVDIVIVLVPSAEYKDKHHVSGRPGKVGWDDGDTVDDEGEHKNWSALSVQMLARAYGDNEPEYSADLIKEANPD